MTYEEVLKNARNRMGGKCKVCVECNGIACRGILPGPAGKGSARAFRRNFTYLTEHVFINMDVVCEDTEKDISTQLFGKVFQAPIFCAPIGLVAFNYSAEMDDESYTQAVVQGAREAGIAAFGGGGLEEIHFSVPMKVIGANEGWGIPTLKPWAMSVVKERIPIMEGSGCFAFAMDIDSAGLPHAGKSTSRMVLKTQEDLSQIASWSSVPFIVKGIMTPESAKKVANAGVYGIVVSNHGGRVLEDALSTAEVLPAIRTAVGDQVKIFVDGGIRTGADVFKMLALGADAVLIGRPYAIAAYGGGAEGVRLYTEKLMKELRDTMVMTGCTKLADITREKISIL